MAVRYFCLPLRAIPFKCACLLLKACSRVSDVGGGVTLQWVRVNELWSSLSAATSALLARPAALAGRRSSSGSPLPDSQYPNAGHLEQKRSPAAAATSGPFSHGSQRLFHQLDGAASAEPVGARYTPAFHRDVVLGFPLGPLLLSLPSWCGWSADVHNASKTQTGQSCICDRHSGRLPGIHHWRNDHKCCSGRCLPRGREDHGST